MKTKITNLGIACACAGVVYTLMWSLSCFSVAAVLCWQGDSLGGAAAKLYFRQASGFLLIGFLLAFILFCKRRAISTSDRIDVGAVFRSLLQVAAVLLVGDGLRFYSASDGGGIVFLVPSILGVAIYIRSFGEVNDTGQP